MVVAEVKMMVFEWLSGFPGVSGVCVAFLGLKWGM